MLGFNILKFSFSAKRAVEEAAGVPPTKKSKGQKKVVPPPKKVESSDEESDEVELGDAFSRLCNEWL